MARTYTQAQKQSALDLYLTHGAAHASRETGIPDGTIKSWASRAGATLRRQETTAGTITIRKLKAAEHKARVTERLWQIADIASELELDLLGGADLRDVVGARTRAIHDAQLLDGAATGRVETADPRRRLADMRDELAARRARREATG